MVDFRHIYFLWLLFFAANSSASIFAYSDFQSASDACNAAYTSNPSAQLSGFGCGAEPEGFPEFSLGYITGSIDGVNYKSGFYCDFYANISGCIENLYYFSGVCPDGLELDPITNECIEPSECSLDPGTTHSGSFGGAFSTSICISDCQFIATGVTVISADGTAFGDFVTNGDTCDGSEGGNTPPDPGDPPPPPDDPDDGCPAGYDISGAGCIAIQPPEPDPDGGDCPPNYFADANGTCWYDPTGAEGGLNDDVGQSEHGGDTGSSGNDSDGDGISNGSDGDIDGDGQPNSTDNDIDGDGVGNSDDIDPTGEEGQGTATNCESKPASSGDAQLAAIHFQLWLNECGSDDSEISDLTDCDGIFNCKSSDPIACAIAKREWTSSCSMEQGLANAESDSQAYFEQSGYSDLDSYGSGDLLDEISTAQGVGDIDLQNEVGDFFNINTSTATCPPPQLVNLGQFGTVEFSLQLFCDLASVLYYVVLLGSYFFGGNIVLRSLSD